MKKLLLILLMLGSSAFGFQNTVIFDLDGVLVYQALADQMWQIGLTKFIGGFNPLKIHSSYFDFLDEVTPRRFDTPEATYKGRLLPQIMCDWLMGMPASSVRQQINAHLNRISPRIDSKQKVKLMRSIANFTFTPERFVKAVRPLEDGVKTLRKVHRKQTQQGQRINRIVILTNYDAESLKLLYLNKSIRRILQLADEIVVSGEVRMMKPDKRIFAYTLEKVGITNKDHRIVFIDDQPENINALESYAITEGYTNCHVFLAKDFKHIRAHLRRLRIY